MDAALFDGPPDITIFMEHGRIVNRINASNPTIGTLIDLDPSSQSALPFTAPFTHAQTMETIPGEEEVAILDAYKPTIFEETLIPQDKARFLSCSPDVKLLRSPSSRKISCLEVEGLKEETKDGIKDEENQEEDEGNDSSQSNYDFEEDDRKRDANNWERLAFGSIKSRVYLAYLKAAGYWLSFAVIFSLVFMQVIA
ncbi:unnamed protein product [Protopolystoma xenopodis]|uniref:Uncharacterized protein n=1 Tax=Protopolystoma xenopodis TaxID=117903 RepID=A0A448XHM6_9PLAT|nr:unnamed protein product [Protopolystoma xenopodis]